jgi:hypothetical protein
VQRNRMSYFLHKEQLKKYQRFFVNKFRFYHLSPNNQQNEGQIDKWIAEEKLIEY